MSTFFTTTSGRSIDLLDPRADDIDFADIGEQLAKENRYNGATPGSAYSVAEHSSRGAAAVYAHVRYDRQAGEVAAAEAAGYFLLHDMPEAFLGDDTTPKKRALTTIAEREFGVLAGAVNDAFSALTARFEAAIAAAAGLAWPPPDEIAALVHRFDRIMLNTEWRDLRRNVACPWPVPPDEAPLAGVTIAPWGWQRALVAFADDCRRWLPGARR